MGGIWIRRKAIAYIAALLILRRLAYISASRFWLYRTALEKGNALPKLLTRTGPTSSEGDRLTSGLPRSRLPMFDKFPCRRLMSYRRRGLCIHPLLLTYSSEFSHQVHLGIPHITHRTYIYIHGWALSGMR